MAALAEEQEQRQRLEVEVEGMTVSRGSGWQPCLHITSSQECCRCCHRLMNIVQLWTWRACVWCAFAW